MLRRLLRTVRHTPDRLLHSHRRAKALDRVATRGPARIVVMCLGNINRSAFAEGVLRRELPEAEIRSAGFLESGRPSPREAVSVAATRGVNLTAHRSTKVTPELLYWADLVIVMSRAQARRIELMAPHEPYIELLGDFDPNSIEKRVVVDPVDRPRKVFEDVFDRIDACVCVLAGSLRGGGGATRTATGVG